MEQLPSRNAWLGFVGHRLLCCWNGKTWILTWANRQCCSHQFLLGNILGLDRISYSSVFQPGFRQISDYNILQNLSKQSWLKLNKKEFILSYVRSG